jgi:flagellar biosynthesis regulator FlbT
MDTPNLADYHAKYWTLAQTILNEVEGAEELIGVIGQEVALGNYYRALKIGKKLIVIEKEGMHNGQ